ncbi:hypothetical protein BDP55DRAFT_720934 [Colletotrichum godetiae]|uniref:Uncharacterized protein n=1 Tax=Colletotrichum godetiae TaxID=1209918 RepID=A0AAJ0ABP5_9PEZI|nr:uncharacterized protein BDP55DRAFT_720934 [Colletotrichum godetiae]KAK1658045.1 hypothetical protein BDP55DRAFT_720934 [Colletotrichum godetiae]
MVSFAKVLTEARRLQRAQTSPRHEGAGTFPPPSFLRPNEQRMVARPEAPIPSRELVRRRRAANAAHDAPQIRSKFYIVPSPTGTDPTLIRLAEPRHVIECMGHDKPAPQLDCPEVDDFFLLKDADVMEDEIWFALTPVTRFWNPSAAYEAKRILDKNRFDCLLVIGLCRDSTRLSLHLLNDYCTGRILGPWRLAEHTLDSLLECNGWVKIKDGIHPERVSLAIGRAFHNGYRVLQRPGSDAEYQGIIVVGAFATHHKLARLREVDWIILHEDVTTMLEYISSKPLRLS